MPSGHTPLAPQASCTVCCTTCSTTGVGTRQFFFVTLRNHTLKILRCWLQNSFSFLFRTITVENAAPLALAKIRYVTVSSSLFCHCNAILTCCIKMRWWCVWRPFHVPDPM